MAVGLVAERRLRGPGLAAAACMLSSGSFQAQWLWLEGLVVHGPGIKPMLPALAG